MMQMDLECLVGERRANNGRRMEGCVWWLVYEVAEEEEEEEMVVEEETNKQPLA